MEQTSDIGNILKEGVASAGDMLFSGLLLRVSEQAEDVVSKFESTAYNMREKMISALMSSLAMAGAVFFLLLAFVFFLIEFLELQFTFAFLIVGLILLVMGLFIKNQR